MEEREHFGSRLGFILVSAGCAIGLGNVWKFPYICGENGGAAFILLYLLCLVALGLPILISEFAIGRASGHSLVKAFSTLEPAGTHWHRFRWFAVVGNYLLMMFYTMVGGWMLCYAVRMISGELSGLTSEQITQKFQGMLDSPVIMAGFMILAVLLAFGTCSMGLKNGVERVTKMMMIALLVLMVVLAVHSLTLPNIQEGLSFYLVPNLDKMHEIGFTNVLFAAMTHAFFTLSVGMGSMEIFGSYLDKSRRLGGEAVSIMLVDTLVALMAGIIIIPACFAYGIQPDAGPSLLFITLPNVFNHMAGGRIWGSAFFVFLSFAALSTIIAVFENILSMTMELADWTRKQAVKRNIAAIIVLSFPAILGFNVLSGIQPLGEGSTIMDLEDFLVSYNVLPLGGLLLILFCTKKNGWGWENFLAEVNTGIGPRYPAALRRYVSYGIPALLIFIYLKGYYDKFADSGWQTLSVWMGIAVVLLALVLGFAARGSAQRADS